MVVGKRIFSYGMRACAYFFCLKVNARLSGNKVLQCTKNNNQGRDNEPH
ncbi:hypothetical protein VAE151_550314 [Vibrio aestuarianus]|uniref:Uncharacterized protein n=1 Tax=Vibrio aestuarianus TaxID=28171 RepID=A0ABM9FPU9_9VIBR|nr:hypothetical protein VAE308_1050318 [Vibrio aestuarianus]CAH8194568.1 hypothetical protein VIBAE_A30912 [Vibrio aestuarianus subsp. francensis]CAH8194846.1 hypothetical protein VAE055_370314 [Vibrio aestuarianus]CAH8194965.1 hypothetical protein VAE032_270315 [Vibrio aestuarianus]CAH8195024.1 hypothetical protein VAE128_460317 [Vibrio aestuarianus]